MALFPGIGYVRVRGKMTAALEGLGLPRPSGKAPRDLRRRLGPAPVKAMFETVAVPLAAPGTPRACSTGGCARSRPAA
jgi:Insertion element 4 transposase N-terminal